MSSQRRAVVATGVSSGIGYAIVQRLLCHGYHVFGSVRKQADAERLTEQFGNPNFTPLVFDVTDELAVRRAAVIVREWLQGQRLSGLVNNAGLMFVAPAALTPIEDMRKLLDINLTGTLLCVQAFLPLLGTDKSLIGPPGRIAMMSSVIAELDMPFQSVYAASKHGLEGLTACLRREVHAYGIQISLIRAGICKTAMWDKFDWDASHGTVWQKDMQAARLLFSESLRKTNITPTNVADAVCTALMTPKPRLLYWVTYLEEWVLALLNTWLPLWLADLMWVRILQNRASAV